MKSEEKQKLTSSEELSGFINYLYHELSTPLSLLMAVDEIDLAQIGQTDDVANVKDIKAAKDSLFRLLEELKELRNSPEKIASLQLSK